MGGNIQYRLILNTMIWAAYVWAFIADEAAAAERSGSWLAYALSSDGGDGTLKYGHRKSKTRSNFQAQKEYVYQRACTFFNFIYLNKVSSGGDVNSIYLMNLALDELWRRIDCSGSPSSHNSAFKSTFASSQEVVNFESQLSSVLDSATAAYESKKREILKL